VDGETKAHRNSLPAIGAVLAALVARMLDPAEPIAHAQDAKYCSFCAGAK